ncbi:hypothetical protein SAMD00019534_012910 [Acytostelium subglobosum LB1]|uniref:hypothetical protein n=1 Tax=Acytostelium subglobosum LB1 TaxID=1410327 RepID=UPI000644AB44|nr:hypothetical protein SAMD00019534_012910 [Acytostelium subglobosum LB1]GAM18116.1 hypothetical protein SAMD00019534_012910 [Acytostelium subglobosum LB1]|eukprot:XP_012758712.1 hypothetical protein SAMD00019534_012910 [Acytostelium subglobosum LB1]
MTSRSFRAVYNKLSLSSSMNKQKYDNDKANSNSTTHILLNIPDDNLVISFLKSLSSRITSVTLGDRFNKVLLPGILPQSLTSLQFGNLFNQVIGLDVLPSSLITLKLGYEFNWTIPVNALPSGLERLRLGRSFNRALIPGVLPMSLKRLILGNSFVEPIMPDVLPTGLTHIMFGFNFRRQYLRATIPETLQVLKEGGHFHDNHYFPLNPQSQLIKPIPDGDLDYLPRNLKRLKLCSEYNKALYPGCLPPTLESLELGTKYNQPLSVRCLPDTLLELELGEYFNQTLMPGHLPASLTSLIIPSEYSRKIPRGVLPNSLTSLVHPGHTPIDELSLPANIRRLTSPYIHYLKCLEAFNSNSDHRMELVRVETVWLGERTPQFKDIFNHLLNDDQQNGTGLMDFMCLELTSKSFMSTARKLIRPHHHASSILSDEEQYDCYGMTTTTMSKPCLLWTSNSVFKYKEHFKSISTTTITSLHLDGTFDQPIEPGTLPPSLQILKMGHMFNQPIRPGSLPDSITMLSWPIQLVSNFNQPFECGSLPASLTDLRMGTAFNQDLTLPGVLPASLVTLYLGRGFNKALPDHVLASLTELGIFSRPSFAITQLPKLKILRTAFSVRPPPSHEGGGSSWPPALTELTAIDHCPVHPLPGSLTKLNSFILRDFSADISLTSLTIERLYNPPRELPRSLKYLCIDRLTLPWNIVSDTLPPTLTELRIGYGFDRPIPPGVLPPSLLTLMLGPKTEYNRPIVEGTLPQSLTYLLLGESFNHPLPKGVLPDSLTRLDLYDDKYAEVDKEWNDVYLPPNIKHLMCRSQSQVGCARRLPPGSDVCLHVSAVPSGRLGDVIFTNQLTINNEAIKIWFETAVTLSTHSKSTSFSASDTIPTS